MYLLATIYFPLHTLINTPQSQVQSRTLKAALLRGSSFDFGDWDAEAIEANNKRKRRRAEKLREELKKGTLTMIINGRNVTITELYDMIRKNKPWRRSQV
jgi:hypothetical protein